jgi:hypothetical protein
MILLAALPLSIPASPAVAQQAERVLVIFGNDPCPSNSAGEEIVVCARRPEEERYRIPKELRPASTSPENTSWAVRSEAIEETGRTGIDSCSAVGAGGWTGCWAQQMRNARRERRQDQANDRKTP